MGFFKVERSRAGGNSGGTNSSCQHVSHAARLCRLFGWFVFSFPFFLADMLLLGADELFFGVLFAISVLVNLCGLWLGWVRLGTKFAARDRHVHIAEDTRPPILYLRPFESDSQGAKSTKSIGYGYGGQLATVYSVETEEEQLASVMNRIGPFIGLGKPTEKLPTIGADREYAKNSEWQKRVIDLTSRAQLVVVHLGISEAVKWEVGEVIKSTSPERVLLLATYPRKYKKLRPQLGHLFPQGLPPWPRKRVLQLWWRYGRSTTTGSIGGIILFDHDWRPDFICLRDVETQTLAGSLEAALKHRFSELERPRPEPDSSMPWDNVWWEHVGYAIIYGAIILFVVLVLWRVVRDVF